MKRPLPPGILARPKDVVMPPQDEPDADQEAYDAQAVNITEDQWVEVFKELKATMDAKKASRGALSTD